MSLTLRRGVRRGTVDPDTSSETADADVDRATGDGGHRPIVPPSPIPSSALARPATPTWSVVALSAGDATTDRNHVLVSDDDLAPPTVVGDRFHHVFEQRCADLRSEARRHLAIDAGPVAFSYGELLAFANQLAHFLRANGVRASHRVAVMMDRSIYAHATVLALSKLDAICVPLDPGFPDDRIGFILDDASVLHAVTLSRYLLRFAGPSGADALALDQCLTEIRRHPASAPDPQPSVGDQADDPVCYIIYTSGSTGRPKGVPIRHRSIVNFLRVAAQRYGYRPSDRVYNGMTIAFDFSMEELWVPLAAGATLVPAPSDAQLVGDDLADFLLDRRITALCCVPTLLGTVRADLPELRLLIVSGEACPPDLARRWLAPGRRMLNLYGPTETTVTATWNVIEADRPVTIGGPLPTYTIAILDPDRPRVLPPGQVGEIAVAGVGVADGYLNRPDRTAKAFIVDPIGLADNPGGLLYRTGDLGRITGDDEIEFLGRIDTQVKIRGYRIELDEIAVSARLAPTVGNAVVDVVEGAGGATELVAYLTPSDPGGAVDVTAVHECLRDRLPAYMLPTYYECLDAIPLLPSTKVDRAALPTPQGPRYVGSGREHVEARTDLERSLAELLAESLGLETVSVEADFFDDLGADSLGLARFATAIRSELTIKRVSIRKLYEHTTITELAARLDPQHAASAGGPLPASPAGPPSPDASTTPRAPAAEVDDGSAPLAPAERGVPDPLAFGRASSIRRRREPRVATATAYAATGVAQVLAFLVVTFVSASIAVAVLRWATGGSIATMLVRTPLAVLAGFLAISAFFTGAKWLLVGRFTTDPIPLWTPAHLRFWVASTLVRAHPMNLFLGTPVYNVHLRLLGASIGSDAIILTGSLVCTDLISIGSGTVVREECQLQGYTARDGWLLPGPITIGTRSYLSAATVLDIHSWIGSGVQIGLASSVLEGQRLGSNRSYQGSPAQPTPVRFDVVPPRDHDRARAWRFALIDLLLRMGLVVPLIAGIGIQGLNIGPSVVDALPVLSSLPDVVGLTIGLYFAGLSTAMASVVVMPRLASLFFRPDTVYPMFTWRYRMARAVTRYSNNRLLNMIFGDSSMILGYLKLVGYDLRRATQTGSNFGVDQRHHSPFLCAFDRNTLVSDGLRMENLELGSTSFRLRPVSVPADTYLGNVVRFPAGSTVGPDCLIATKAAVPLDGEIRTHVGLLGSPAFEIPRSVARDHAFDHFKQPGVFERRLELKLRSNLVTVGLFVARSLVLLLATLFIGATLLDGLDPDRQSAAGTALAVTLTSAAMLLLTPLFSIACDWAVRGFRPLEPLYCSLYDRRFWRHERFWKLSSTQALAAFSGTPLKPVFLRLQGARVGARMFDDGGGFPEPSLVSLGDHVTLNRGSTVQSHSLEDGTFKSDRTSLGSGATLGVRAFVHYGVTVEERSLVDADSFVMKGSTVPADSHWLGNPARSVEDDTIDRTDQRPAERTSP